MLYKRRITVSHVDDAVLCGGEGSFHHIVSVFNGADHPLKTPVPSENPPKPSISRLLAHSFHGAVEVDVQLSATDEYVLAASANEAGVVACRVCPAPPSTGCFSAQAWRSPTAHRLAFFSGRQRLAEVVVDANPIPDPAAIAAATSEGSAPAAPHHATAEQCQASYDHWKQIYRRFPMQCFRAGDGVDVAVFVVSPRVLCACTPLANKEQFLTFERSDIACVGGGRQGRAEVTVLLEDGTLLLCGLASSQGTRPGHRGDDSARQNGGDIDSSSRESSLYRVRGSFAGATPSTSLAHRPRSVPLSAPMTAEAGQLASAYLAESTAMADSVSNLSVLSIRSLTPRLAPSTGTASASSPSSSMAPGQLLWAGQQTLWVVYADGLVRAYWWPAAATNIGASSTSTSMPPPHGDAHTVFEGRLGAHSTSGPDQVVLSADARTPTLHYGYRCGADADFHYGTFKLSHTTSTATAAGTPPTYVHTASLEFSVLFSEVVYGLRLHAGRIHVLSQARRGDSPLFVSGLPRGNPVEAAAQAGMNPPTDLPLHLRILWDPEAMLATHCQQCAVQLAQLGESDASGFTFGETEEALQDSIAQLQTMAHSVHALLLRSREADGVVVKDSYPAQLLQRVHIHAARLAAAQLVVRCCTPRALQTPLRELLALTEARRMSQCAQQELQALVDASPISTAAAANSKIRTDSNAARSRATLCVDVLLRHLPSVAAVLDESRLTVASVLSTSQAMTPALALFIVYCSYQGMEACVTNTSRDEQIDHGPALCADALRVQEAHRVEFLARFNVPGSWCSWAMLAYAADHRVPIPSLPSAGDEASTAASATATGPGVAQLMAARHAFAHQLGVPPYKDLLAPLVTGMMQAGAFDAALHVIGTILACCPASAQDLPPALAQKLLFLAVHAGCSEMVEQLYVASRSTQTSSLCADSTHASWSPLATQALALSALATQAREANASKTEASKTTTRLVREMCLEPLRGLVAVASPEGDAVEAVIQAHPDVLQREYMLLRFYTLTQRYADAVHACQRIASSTPAEAQRVQIVASYLASLCPYENTNYMASSSRSGDADVQRRTRDERANEEADEQTDDGLGRSRDPFHTLTRVAPTQLESSDQDLRAQLERTMNRLNPAASSSARVKGNGVIISGSTPVTVSAGERVLRPSSILASAERVPTSDRSTSTTTTVTQPLASPFHDGYHSHRRDENEEGVNIGDAYVAPSPTSDGGQVSYTRVAQPLNTASSFAAGFNRGRTCEATIQRSGKLCGRERPCPYHDKR